MPPITRHLKTPAMPDQRRPAGRPRPGQAIRAWGGPAVNAVDRPVESPLAQ
jgi:hypothetical protein